MRNGSSRGESHGHPPVSCKHCCTLRVLIAAISLSFFLILTNKITYRLPLYYPLKTMFLLYLSLPQTQGSSYIYTNYLQPFLHYHEADIDATMGKLKAKFYNYLHEKLRIVWNAILGSLGQQPPVNAADTAAPPSVGDPVSGPAQLLGGLWQSYGPKIVASGATLFTAASAAAAASQAQRPALNSQPPSQRHIQSNSKDRRKQYEAEQAPFDEHHLNSSGSDEDFGQPMRKQQGSSAYSRVSSDADLRSRGGQYEEVEVPSDVEGYDVGPSAGRSGGDASRQSWFGWGGGTPQSEKKRE